MEPTTTTETIAGAGEAALQSVETLTLLDRYHLGGVFMHPIAIVGLVALFIILERFVTLVIKTKYDKAAILGEVRNAIYSGKLFISGQTIIHKIIESGFQAFEKSQKESEVQLAIDAAASKYFPILEKRTGYLTMLANISTLLGLLGTISGLIQSFAGAAKADPTEKATLLASGIAEAMHCTAFGLIIAIPSLLAYAFLQGRTQGIIDEINEIVLESMNFVVTHKDELSKKAK